MNIFHSINPFTQETMAAYPEMNDRDKQEALEHATTAYSNWCHSKLADRAVVLRNVAHELLENKKTYASIITNEMGKIFAEAIAEIEKCALVCNYYADHADEFLANEKITSESQESFISYEPIGAVFGIMPWNYPFWQVFRFAAPTLMAGNVVFLKHAPNVMGCAFAIQEIFKQAGAPKGLFQSLAIDIPALEKFISTDIVQAVTLTGSGKAGSSFAALAGKYKKKSVLELGGSDALIVLADADIEKAAKTAIQSRMQNAGQSCIASKRFIVMEEIHDSFVEAILKEIALLKQGDPFSEDITTGPMARLDLAEKLETQMQETIQEGAVLETGGRHNGCNFSPGLLLRVRPGMCTFREEIFGPLASVIVARNEMEAINLANQSSYGLGGSIWTKDIAKGRALAKRIQAGSVFVNTLVKSDARMPFGGVKNSGYGRELGRNGIHEFVNVKTIVINP